jgi:hypothetical protein
LDLFDATEIAAIFVATWPMQQKIANETNIEFAQQCRPFRAHAVQDRNG